MCTLILGVAIAGPGTLLLAANRDEDPARPSDPPAVLRERPRVVGGRDRLSGGTWLAVRGREAVVAVLNRRDLSGAPSARDPSRRSRGLLALDLAAADDPESEAMAATERALYAPFTLVHAAPDRSWAVEFDGVHLRHLALEAGWHVVTHASPDDRSEPRTARLLDALAGFRPESRDAAEARVTAMLRWHGEDGRPAVCIHAGRMVTVSAARVWLGPHAAAYAHAEGRPCEAAFQSCDSLLA